VQSGAFWSLKNKHFKQKHSNVHQLPTSSLNYHLPQTSANYVVLDMVGDQCKSKCTTWYLIWILCDQFGNIGSSKVQDGKSTLFRPTFKSEMDFTIPAVYVPHPPLIGMCL